MPSGNFVYLASDPGDYIGQGAANTYTSNIVVSATGATLGVTVAGYGGTFQGMNAITTLERGYYPNMERYPFHQPAKGGMSWEGNGRGCNMLTGWFVIDAITYQGGQLAAVDLRFEQHCEGGVPALHGALHWVNAP
jgi:hypothetical protein